MAYNFQDIDPEAMGQTATTEEERKRRLAMLANLASGGTMGDVATQALTDRANKATDKMEQISQVAQPQQPVAPVSPTTQAQPVQAQPTQAQEAVSPVTPEQLQQPVQQTQLPQPGPAIQVAEATQAQPDWHTQLNSGDFGSLSALAQNKEAPDFVKTEAKDRIYTILNDQRQQAKANTTIDSAMSGNAKAVSDLTKELTKRNDEGSMLKAMLYSRLGLSELAKDEQQKLGAGVKYEATVGPNNTRALIKYGADNLPLSGFDESGKQLSQEDLAKFAANAMPTKAHLMPSVHGSPVVNDKGEIGTLMYDPRSQSNYVQVGSERKPTTGWTTMAQNVSNVYNQAQAGALGKGAGEGFTPSPMKPLPGAVAPVAPGSVQAPVQGAASTQERAQGDVAGLQREIASTPNTPANQPRIQILNQELAKAKQQAGAVQGLPAQAKAAQIPGVGVAQQKANLAIQEAQQKEGIQVAGQRSQAFNKILDEEVRPQAQNGDTIVNTRKQQFQIFDRPGVDASKLFGIANGAGQAPGDQRWTMLRDTLLGKTTATDDQIRERAAQLGLNREEQAALAEYNIANAKINAATLKQTAGAGSVSDAEQRANREMNVDPTKIPAMGAYNAMAQSQFSGDMARYKADWAATHPATNALQLDKAWRKESQTLTEMYADIAKQRAKFISENGATTAAVKEGYKRFPIPEYDPQTEKWKKTKPLSQILGQ